MPKTHTRQGNWDYDLRASIKRKLGSGWGVVEQSGATKLTRRDPTDGTRSSVMLDIPFDADHDVAISTEVQRLAALMQEHGLSLRDAHKRGQGLQGVATAKGVQVVGIDWQKLAENYLATKEGNRHSTQKETRRRINNVIQLMTSKPRPTDGRSLMTAYAEQFFKRAPAGGMGRIRHLSDVAAFLDWAIGKRGIPKKWQPLRGEDRQLLIGTAGGHDDHLTPPVKPEQLASLIDALQGDNPNLWLAVCLVGCFGLRPAELAVLRVEGGKLYVGGQVKRNNNSKNKPPRRVIALEVQGRNDGARALAAYSSGLIKLPKQIRTAIESGELQKVGKAFRQMLDSDNQWKTITASSDGIVPYSLRHGYAWRAHKHYDRALSVRDTAALMGHTVATHMKHYGAWTDEQGLEDAVSALTASQPATKETQAIS